MKKIFLIYIVLFSVLTVYGQKVVFMPGWIEQAQWAGYYMADKLGFYKDEGLDVEIVHPQVNTSVSAFETLGTGKVNIISGHLLTAIKLRSKGYPIINVLQTSQHSSLCCVTRYRMDSVQQLKEKTIARWKSEFGEGFDFINSKFNLNINWIPYVRNVNVFIFGAVDGILCCKYNEYVSILTSMGSVHSDCVFNASDFGYDYPEDGLYVTNHYLVRNRNTVEKFVRASIRGWEYARNHPSETTQYVLDLMRKNHIPTNTYSQKEMLKIIFELQKNKFSGEIDFSPVSLDEFYEICAELEKVGKLPNQIKYTDFIKDLRPQN